MVILILYKNNLGGIIVFCNLVRTGTDQIGAKAPVLTGCGTCVLREDICVGGTNVLYKRCKWILERDIEVIIIHDLKAGQLGSTSCQHILCAFDHVEVSSALCCGSRSKHTLKGEFDILTGQLGAVGEMYALL